MNLKMRQIAALILTVALCLGSAIATGPEPYVPEVEPYVPDVEPYVPPEVEPEEPEGDDEPDVPVEGDDPWEEPTPGYDPNDHDVFRNTKLRIGLAYPGNSIGALAAANLANADISAVTGYRFGYFDSDLNFISLASTRETALTVVKSTRMYRVGEEYYDTAPNAGYEELGCYHIQLPYAMDSYEEAKDVSLQYSDSFVAWIDGEYRVRRGAFSSADEARKYADTDWDVCWTSTYGVNVVTTGTNQILFQFDGGEGVSLGVMPGAETDEGAVTWFRGYKYRGGFRYERVDGGNIVVVNIVDVDSYVKGVVPYESNKLWPLETLKAQALCAKNYALINRNRHNSYHFDLCTTTDCQVYYGMGSNKADFQPSALSDRAVEETQGIYVWYGDSLAHTYYYSSNGGGSEDSSKVWGSNQASYPYLLGVVDNYEQTAAHMIPNYAYSNLLTCDQLTQILQTKGYATNTRVVDFKVTEYSKSGNALTIKFIYANGKSNTFSSSNSSWLRSKLGCRSLHFTVTGAGNVINSECAVNAGQADGVEDFAGLYAIGADGALIQMEESVPYIVTGSGEVVSAGQPNSVPEGSFLISGTGWGHNVGYSQWGGYAMANLGYTYDQILKFYFTGVEVGEKAE